MSGRRPAVSVNTSLSSNGQFSQYLRSAFQNRHQPVTFVHLPHAHPTQGLAYRPQSGRPPAPRRAPLATMNASASNTQAFAPGYSDAQVKAYFAMDPDDEALSTPFIPQVFQQTEQLPFRPIGPAPAHGSFFGPATIPVKQESSAPVGVPPILLTNIDPSQYDPVSLEECMSTPVEYGSVSSSSSSITNETSPRTPSADGYDALFDYYAQRARNIMPTHTDCYGGPYVDHQHGSFGSVSSNSSTSFGVPAEIFHQHQQPHTQPQGLAITYTEPVMQGDPLATADEVMFSDAQSEQSAEDDLSSSASASSSTEAEDARDRRTGHEYIVQMRSQGYTYKEIKKLGKFTEAESTLRGRYRVLTKGKEQRVRRPKWQQSDVSVDSSCR